MPRQPGRPVGQLVQVVVLHRHPPDRQDPRQDRSALDTLEHAMSRLLDGQSVLSAVPLPRPLDDTCWAAVVRELELAPQQERIVRLIMQSKGDKQIARELGLAFPTVRTYLNRVFDRAGVEDRMQLVHRIYAIAINAWSRDRCPPS